MFEPLTGSGFLAARRPGHQRPLSHSRRAAVAQPTCIGSSRSAPRIVCSKRVSSRSDRSMGRCLRISFAAAEKDGSIGFGEAEQNPCPSCIEPDWRLARRTRPQALLARRVHCASVLVHAVPCAFFLLRHRRAPKSPSESLVTRLSSAATDAASKPSSRNRF